MITAPGIYPNLSMSQYLAQPCPGPSVSGSELARIDATTPAHFYAQWSGNPDRAEREQTAAMAFGSAFHKYTLEGRAAFDAEYAIKPEDMSFATKEGKQWRSENIGKGIVTAAEWRMIVEMAGAMRAKPKTAALLTGARPEVTLAREENGVWLKSRPDAMNDKLQVAVNLKTCEDASEDAVRKSIESYGGSYYVSAALCVDMLKALTGDDWQYVFVFCEKTAPYESRRVVLKPTVLEWGRMRYRRALATFAECVKSGRWPGYDDATIEADLPPWAEKKLQARHEAGEFTQEAA